MKKLILDFINKFRKNNKYLLNKKDIYDLAFLNSSHYRYLNCKYKSNNQPVSEFDNCNNCTNQIGNSCFVLKKLYNKYNYETYN